MSIFLFFEDFFNDYLPKVGNELFTHIYLNKVEDFENIYLRCGLIPECKIQEALSKYEWDILYRGGQPDFVTCYDNDKHEYNTVYQRYGNDEGYESLLISREFNGIVKDYTEISEEFRLFHNLHFDKDGSKYIKFDEDGEPIDIIFITENEIKVRTKELKEFISVKKMALGIYFSIIRYDENSPSKEDFAKYVEFPVSSDYYFHLSLDSNSLKIRGKNINYTSFLLGKKLVTGIPDFSVYDYINKKEVEQYEDFIIGQKADGEPIISTCNPNIVKKNYLKPVYFKKEVLKKYYDNPEKYEIDDNYLRCSGLWGLKFDNNHSDYVITALGDLGRDLTYKEQKYWRSYNVLPTGGYSDTTYNRWIKGEFADSDREDILFKSKFDLLQEKWFDKNQWNLFLPLKEGDEFHLNTLRIPLTNNQLEFDNQVQSFTKILIDSINEKEISKTITVNPDDKGITKLANYLTQSGFIEFEIHIKFIRNLQSLRSTGVAHRKGKEYQKIAASLQIGELSNIKVFENILKSANNFIDYLISYLERT